MEVNRCFSDVKVAGRLLLSLNSEDRDPSRPEAHRFLSDCHADITTGERERLWAAMTEDDPPRFNIKLGDGHTRSQEENSRRLVNGLRRGLCCVGH